MWTVFGAGVVYTSDSSSMFTTSKELFKQISLHWCLSVTCDRSVVFYGYSRFPSPINWPPRYNWNIVERYVRHYNSNPKINIYIDGCVFKGFAIYIVLFVLLAVKLSILFDLRLLPTHPPFRHLLSFFDEYKIKTSKKTNQALYKIFNFVLKINYIWLKVKLEKQKTFCSW